MANKQTRRTISFNREIHAAIHREAQRRGLTASHFVETLIRAAISEALPETSHTTPANVDRMLRSRRIRRIDAPRREVA